MNADAANEVIVVVRWGKVSATSLDGFAIVNHNCNLSSVRRISSLQMLSKMWHIRERGGMAVLII